MTSVLSRTRASAIVVGLGEVGATRADGPGALMAHGLGSCVAVCLFDPDAGVAGMAHVVLPVADPRDRPNARFAGSALPALLESLVAMGGARDLRRYQARLAGGAHVLTIGGAGRLPYIGDQNANALRAALAAAEVEIHGEHLGGGHGRTVVFDPRDGGPIRVRMIGRDEIRI